MRELGALVWPHVRPHRLLLVAGAGLGVLMVALRVAQPWPLKWVLDLLTSEPLPAFLDRLAETLPLGIAGLSLLYVLITLAAAGAEYGQLMLLAGLGNRVLHGFRAQLFVHVLRQPLSFHEGRETGELLTRVVYDTARLRQGVNGWLTKVFQTVATFLATSAVLLWLDAQLAAVVVGTGVVALAAMSRSGRRIARAARRQRRREGRLATIVEEALLGIRELQSYRAGTVPDERFARQNVKSLRQEQRVRRLGAALFLRVEVVLAVGVALILWLGARAVHVGRLTPGDIVLFVSYAVGLYRPLIQFARQAARTGKTLACADRLTKLMARAPAIADRPGAVAAPPLRGDFALEHVSVASPRKQRGSRKWALREATLSVAAGERLAILGPNGAGKSTLLRLALRLADPTEGHVLLDGRDVREYTIASLRRQVSVVFQDSVFFGLSVRDNIALGGESGSLDAVREAARRACIADFIEHLPEGFDTRVRRRGGLLSGGERQRIALARALLRDGRLWLLDEPTTGIDAATAAELIKLLLDVTAGRTVLWVTHEPQIVRLLDRVVVLDQGRVVFSGAPDAYGGWLALRVSSPAATGSKGI